MMRVTEYNLFPTKLLSLQFPDVDDFNQGLYDTFTRIEDHQKPEYFANADHTNLLDLAPAHPCIGRVHEMFLEGLEMWLQSAALIGEYDVSTLMFANYAKQHQFTITHNHVAHVVGVYYVKTATGPDAPDQTAQGPATPWDQDNGGVDFHDPRFNASLVDLSGDHYFKIQPTAGQMLLFPGFLWHSVTPNLEIFRRLSMSVNFHLEPRRDQANDHPAPVRRLSVKARPDGGQWRSTTSGAASS